MLISKKFEFETYNILLRIYIFIFVSNIVSHCAGIYSESFNVRSTISFSTLVFFSLRCEKSSFRPQRSVQPQDSIAILCS